VTPSTLLSQSRDGWMNISDRLNNHLIELSLKRRGRIDADQSMHQSINIDLSDIFAPFDRNQTLLLKLAHLPSRQFDTS
jgi:hypothetical protein